MNLCKSFNYLPVLFFAIAMIQASCAKKDIAPENKEVIVNTYNVSLSAVSKLEDSLALDVDKDGIKDFTVFAGNTQNTFYQVQPSYSLIGFNPLSNNIEFLCDKGVFGRLCLPSTYCVVFALAIAKGVVINGPNYNWRSYAVNMGVVTSLSYNDQSTGLGTAGLLINTTAYIAFRIKKADGYHYGWLLLSNSNNCRDATIYRSAYNSKSEESINTF